MNFFEQELGRLAAACAGISNPVFAGRACYGDLGGDNRIKLQFVTLGYADHYEALKATVLNRAEGEVDTLLFRFGDIWGKKMDTVYHNGIPHIWTDSGKSEWYGYRPTDADFRQLAAAVGAYLEVFTMHTLTRQKDKAQTGGSVVEKLREVNRKPAAQKKPSGHKKSGPEL